MPLLRLLGRGAARLLELLLTRAARLAYRLQVCDGGHVPTRGGAVIVANHLSWLDWLFVMAGVRRPV
ncbi:MAG TPA: 1-acyl-sn-glycerol-3-phosphate acyltransferase, partial [Verrucomicrobiae bacterium]|nr:1-acyl-sn-glycerol-3-phosphate acyltransferase [Verrucomicrobiae bacterium]